MMRILKQHRRIEHDTFEARVSRLSLRPVDDRIIRKSLESLMNRSYIEDRESAYHYLA